MGSRHQAIGDSIRSTPSKHQALNTGSTTFLQSKSEFDSVDNLCHYS